MNKALTRVPGWRISYSPFLTGSIFTTPTAITSEQRERYIEVLLHTSEYTASFILTKIGRGGGKKMLLVYLNISRLIIIGPWPHSFFFHGLRNYAKNGALDTRSSVSINDVSSRWPRDWERKRGVFTAPKKEFEKHCLIQACALESENCVYSVQTVIHSTMCVYGHDRLCADTCVASGSPIPPHLWLPYCGYLFLFLIFLFIIDEGNMVVYTSPFVISLSPVVKKKKEKKQNTK